MSRSYRKTSVDRRPPTAEREEDKPSIGETEDDDPLAFEDGTKHTCPTALEAYVVQDER